MTHAEALQFLEAATSARDQEQACRMLNMDRRQYQNRKAHFRRMGIALPKLPGQPCRKNGQTEMTPAEWDDIRRRAAELEEERKRAEQIEAGRAAAEKYRNGNGGRS